jgi:hypothetical protein
MKMIKQGFISAILVFLCFQMSLADQETVGTISNVIVYRGQALVTRVIELELPAGGSQIVVQKLPNAIVSESLYAQVQGGATVSSVRYRERAVKEDTREEVKQLEAEIREVETSLRHAESRRRLIISHVKALNKLMDFTIDAEKKDLNKGVLQFEPLRQLVEFKESRHSEHNGELLKVDDEILELKEKLELLRRKLEKLQAGRSRTEREAVLFVNNPETGKVIIELNYLVNEASWLPQYNLRANPEQAIASVEYNAVIHQASGEDWNDVALSLSTAQPTTAAGAPGLESMEIRVAPSVPQSLEMEKEPLEEDVRLGMPAGGRYRDLTGQFQQLQKSRSEMARKGKAAQDELNVTAVSNQMMELMADKKAVQVIQTAAKRFARTEGVSVTYALAGPITMPSRSDQQLVNIASFKTKADFLMLATPLLTDYVYLQADIVNDSSVIMLAGPASMYRNGEFVGKGSLEMVTIGEKFTAGFGVDSQIKILREFKDKKIETLWGNRVENYDYRLAINNYKSTKVKLRLLERIPYTEDEKLEIMNFRTDVSLSTDPEYLRTDRQKGILRWDLNLEPSTTGPKATIVTYSYAMKYSNELQIQPVR